MTHLENERLSFAAMPLHLVLLCRHKFHQRERRTTIWSIGIAERFRHLQMVVVRCLDDLHRFARRFDRSREVTAQALKVRGFQGAICDSDRRV